MNKTTKILIIVGVILLLFIIFFSSCINMHNNMIRMQEAIKNAWAQVDNQLQRRYDLIPNLVNTVKGYAKHEKEIFIKIAEARSKLAGATSYPSKVQAANQMESAISRLLVVVENYPLLKADANFRALMDELSGTENRIAVERKRYNDKVNQYNQYIKVFPNSIIANMYNFKEAEYFKIPEIAKSVPKVEF